MTLEKELDEIQPVMMNSEKRMKSKKEEFEFAAFQHVHLLTPATYSGPYKFFKPR